MAQHVIVGRGSDCDLVLAEPSVSSRHARLSWRDGRVWLEDLGSANGTFVAGKPVRTASVRPGDDVRLGRAALPWSSPALRPFLRSGAQGTRVLAGLSPARRALRIAGRVASGATLALTAAVLVALAFPSGREYLGEQADRVRSGVVRLRPARSDEEAYIRSRLATRVAAAVDPSDPLVRDTAVRLAARVDGPFRVEQVAAIWGFVRERWRYVNDPNGREYFATAHESIQNGYAGDCDDFAITLGAMVGAIGGRARVIFMQDPQGGHAYAEACIEEDAGTVATKLARYYGRHWTRYTPAGRPAHIAYRSSADCPVWLNLDWNASVPGGDYQPEQWAVAIYTDATTETLAAASATSEQTAVPGASRPRTTATPASE